MFRETNFITIRPHFPLLDFRNRKTYINVSRITCDTLDTLLTLASGLTLIISLIIQFENCSHQPLNYNPHSTVIFRKYFKNISLKSYNIARIFIMLLERFLKYYKNLAMSV